MNEIKTVAVYCGSNTGRGDIYMRAAANLGSELASRGMNIVYGGTHKGLMGALADAALAESGQVVGVITERLQAKGHTHPNLSAIEVLPTMQIRKKRMIEMADAFIAMPGGIGTLEEFMEVWTLNQLGEIAKPAGLYDVGGYYQPLIGMVDHMIDEQFLPAAHREAIVVREEALDLVEGLINFVPVTVQKWMS
ncbi:MAG: TIGR00730 family Rossman fold protein [Roseobacter sp.]